MGQRLAVLGLVLGAAALFIAGYFTNTLTRNDGFDPTRCEAAISYFNLSYDLLDDLEPDANTSVRESLVERTFYATGHLDDSCRP